MRPYPSYKDSGVEWIGEIPNHWTKKNLKYSFNIQKGKIPKETFDEPNESSLPYLSMDVLRGNTTPQYCDISDGVRVNNKDLLILWDGSKSGEILYGNDGILSSTMSKMDLIDSNLEKPFCYYLLKYYERDFQYNTVGMGIPHMDGDHLKFSKLIIPPLPEQKQIISFLDHKTQKIDELIENTEQKIELLKEKRTSLINHCVTKGLNPNVEMKDSGDEWIGEIPSHWEVKRVKYLLNDFDGIKIGPFGSSLKLDTLTDNGIKVYGQGNIIKDDFKLGHRYLPLDRFEEDFTQYEILDGDVLVTMMGTTGKSKMFSSSYERGILDSHLLRLRFSKSKFSSHLFSILLEQSDYVFQQLKLSSKGSIMEGLNSSIIKEIKVLTPPIGEQDRLLEYLDEQTQKIDSTIEKETQRIELLKEYRQSLISEVVTGKIDVRDWKE